MVIFGASFVVAFLVLVFGVWWAIRAFIAGAVVEGVVILFFVGPAVAIAQGVVSIVAVPFGMLADGSDW